MSEPAGQYADQWMALARRWDGLVAEVRELPGFTDFLKVPTFDALRRTADAGPVVMLNAMPSRCDAIIVRPDGAKPVLLEELTIDSVADHTRRYLKAIHDYQDSRLAQALTRRRIEDGDSSYEAFRAHDEARTRVAEQRDPMESVLMETLEWIWSGLARPVLAALGLLDGASRPPPRLWWCPTGILTFLPIHAAGRHTADVGQTVLDTVVSSYTPSLRALLAARSRPEQPLVPARLVLVAVPDAEGASPLPMVAEEAATLGDSLGDRCTVRDGEGATRREVLRALRAHRFAHFSCHGQESPSDPSQAGIILNDGLLSVRDIAAERFTGEFAFLSACKTATGVARLPDEAMSLAAALHYAGFRHVVATQWSVYDTVASQVTQLFYGEAVVGGRFVPARSATALHHAVRQIRDDHRDRPSSWIPYVHQGP